MATVVDDDTVVDATAGAERIETLVEHVARTGVGDHHRDHDEVGAHRSTTAGAGKVDISASVGALDQRGRQPPRRHEPAVAYTATMSEASPNPGDAPDELRTQIDELRAELATALESAREAELAAGRLRGELAEMRVQLGRARQEQEWALTARSIRLERWRESAGATIGSARRRLGSRLGR